MADSGCSRMDMMLGGGGGGTGHSLSTETLTLIRKPYVHKVAGFDCLHIFAATCATVCCGRRRSQHFLGSSKIIT